MCIFVYFVHFCVFLLILFILLNGAIWYITFPITETLFFSASSGALWYAGKLSLANSVVIVALYVLWVSSKQTNVNNLVILLFVFYGPLWYCVFHAGVITGVQQACYILRIFVEVNFEPSALVTTFFDEPRILVTTHLIVGGLLFGLVLVIITALRWG